MKVSELMTREVKSCIERDSLQKVAKVMWDNDCGCVPVVDEENSVTGVVTDRDICMAAYTQGVPLYGIQVQTAMARTVVCCTENDDLATAEELMRQNQVRRLPVVNREGRLVGILSINDIAREAGKERAAGAKLEVGDTEVAETMGAISQPHGHVLTQFTFGPEEGELEYVPGAPQSPWRKGINRTR